MLEVYLAIYDRDSDTSSSGTSKIYRLDLAGEQEVRLDLKVYDYVEGNNNDP